MQEEVAMESYMDQTGNIVEECGLLLNPFRLAMISRLHLACEVPFSTKQLN